MKLEKILINQSRLVALAGAFLAILLSGDASAGQKIARVWVNGVEDGVLLPGVPAVLEMAFYDTDPATGERVILSDFIPFHMKMMHLVAVRSDLTTFSHFHPYYDGMSGEFQIPLHFPVRNKDNQSAETAFMGGGRYELFMEVKSEAHGMLEFRHALEVSGNASERKEPPLRPDTDGRLVQYFSGEGEPAGPGAPLRVQMTTSQLPACGGVLVKFHFNVEEKLDAEKPYGSPEGLEKWMMMGGHSIVMSQSGRDEDERFFAHLHAEFPESGGAYELSQFNRGAMAAGVYKIWLQIKKQGRVMTFPFVFDFAALPASDCLEENTQREEP